MDKNLEIGAFVDKAALDKAKKEFGELTVRVKELDYQFRQQKISADNLKNGLGEVDKRAKALNLTYKQTVDINAQIFQVQQRAANNFKSLSTNLASMEKQQNTANQSLIALSQGMQDSAQFSMGFNQGLRGVANNIQQTAQMFALLYRETGSVKGAFAGLMKGLSSPAGLLVGLAAVTTAIQVIPTLFKDAAKAAKESLEQMTDYAQLFVKYGFGFDVVKNVDLAKAVTQQKIQGMSTLRPIYDPETRKKVGEKWVANAGSESEVSRLKANLAVIEEFEKKNKEPLDKERERAKIHGIINELMGGDLDILLRIDEESKKKRKEKIVLDAFNVPSKSFLGGSKMFPSADFGTEPFISPMQRLFGRESLAPDARAGVWNRPQTGKEWLKQQQEVADLKFAMREAMIPEAKDILKESVAAYNSLFFDPLRAGFRAIGDEIRQGLFGSLEDLKAKFGNVGAAIINSLNQVIAKLIEMAIAASILSLLSGGGLGVWEIMKKLLMPGALVTEKRADGGWIHEPVMGVGTKTGKTYSFGERGSEYVLSNQMANDMILGGSPRNQPINVIVQGKLSGGDIYIAGKSYESMQNSVRANG